LGSVAEGDALRRFQAKRDTGRAPVRVKKARQVKTPEFRFDLIEAGF
jgi:hypothetical protein